MKLARILLPWCLAAVAVWFVLCAAIGIVATEAALHPHRYPVAPELTLQAQDVAARHHAALAAVAVTAGDGVTLRAWSIRPRAGNGDAVILLHGVADNRAGMLGNADMLLGHGYAVLLPDARAHGDSGG